MGARGFFFWQKWLLVVGGYLVLFGLVLVFFNQSFVMDFVFNKQIDPYFWKTGELPKSAQEFQSWIYGVLGAVISGWGVFIIFLAKHPFEAREKWAWNCTAAGTGTWYVTDTWVSAVHHVFFNLLFNTLMLILLALPLLFTRKYFRT